MLTKDLVYIISLNFQNYQDLQVKIIPGKINAAVRHNVIKLFLKSHLHLNLRSLYKYVCSLSYLRPKVLEKHWLLTFQIRLHKDIEHILWHFLEPFNYLFVKLHTFVIAFPFSSRHIYQIFIQIQTDFSFLFLNTGFSRDTRIL